MAKRRPTPRPPIGWERARGIFGDPPPPPAVWERQFDGFDEELRRLARTPLDRIDVADLWYYYHDLAYVELQPDLFDYLFPACLMDWHHTLRNDEDCSRGDSDFHRGLYRGEILEKMVTPDRRDAIYEFFRDSFAERLDSERGFVGSGSKSPAYSWVARFNSLGIVMPRIDVIWESWWSLDTPGQAVAVLEYCSGLMYFEGENPLFSAWTREHGGGGPCLWESDAMIYDACWMQCNLDFLRSALTVESVNDVVTRAVARLRGEPESEEARRLRDDLPGCRELLTLRVAELPLLLGLPSGSDGWSV